MEVEVPWRAWRGLVRDGHGDVTAAAAAISLFFQDGGSAIDAICSLWRVWRRSDGDADVAAVVLLVAAATSGERALVSHVLQSSPCDAARDLQEFMRIAGDWHDAALKKHLYETAVALCSTSTIQEDSWADDAVVLDALDTSTPLSTTRDGRAVLQHVDDMVAVEAMRLTRREPQTILRDAIERFASCYDEDTTDDDTSVEVASEYVECPDDATVRAYVSTLEDCVHRDTPQVHAALPSTAVSTSDRPTTQDAATLLQELESIDDLFALSIRVSAVLAWQLKTGVALVAGVDHETAQSWKRSIRKQVNSLTSGGDATLELLRYAALDPATLIDVAIESIATTTQHHAFFAQLLWSCPVLVRWTSTRSSQVVNALVQELARLIDDDSTESPVAEAPVVQFLVEASATTQVFEPDGIIDHVLWETLEMIVGRPEAVTSVTRLLTVAHRYFIALREGGLMCSDDVVTKSFRIVQELYKRFGRETVVEFRDVALAICQDILLATSSQLQLDEEGGATGMAIQTLLETYNARPLASYWDDLSSNALIPITAAVTASIQHALWSLVWGGVSNRLADVAACVFADASGASIAGVRLIQVEMAKVLLASGRGSFDRILKIVETVLLPMLRQVESSESATPSEVMDWAVRCWCIGAFAAQDAPTDAVFRLLDYTLRPVDHAIEAAAQDPDGLRQCLQTIGVMNAWLSSNSESIRFQALAHRVEIAAVRVLFLLAQLPSQQEQKQPEETLFRQSIARILTESRLLDHATVARFLQTAVR